MTRLLVSAMLEVVFDGIAVQDVVLEESAVHVRHHPGGDAVVLLHGHPRTGATWHRIAPVLAEAGLAVVVRQIIGRIASGRLPATSRSSWPISATRGSRWSS